MQEDAGEGSDAIQRPDGFHPSEAPLHARNQFSAQGTDAGAVWAWLIRAERWAEWYDNCSDLEFLDDTDGPDLQPGTSFRWHTFGVTIQTQIEVFEPPRRLGWSGSGLGWEAYHAWRIDERDGGCHLLTEETQRGVVPTLLGWYLRPQLLEEHQRWLEGLADRAAGGPPEER